MFEVSLKPFNMSFHRLISLLLSSHFQHLGIAMLVNVKDPTPPHRIFNIVYSIPCMTCFKVYIGQTCRSLQIRIKTAVKYAKCNVSADAEHVWECIRNHHVNFSILARDCNLNQCLFLEFWFIRKSSTFNGEIGSLPPVYINVCFNHFVGSL